MKRTIPGLLITAVILLGCNLLMPARSKDGLNATPAARLAAQAVTITPTRPAAPQATETTAPQDTLAPTETAIPAFDENGVRMCYFVPGVSQPAVMPPEVLATPAVTPFPTPTLLPPVAVDGEVTKRQVRIFQALWDAVNENYVYPDFNGKDWQAIGDKYKAIVQQGVSEEDFPFLMNEMIFELGDEHSYYLSAEQAAEDAERMSGNNNFVGIGAMSAQLASNPEHAVITSIFPGSAAQDAGLRVHDILMGVDGGPLYDDLGAPRTLGEEGTEFTLTTKRPGEAPRDLQIVRRRVSGAMPVDSCIFPGTRIGYIYLPTFMDDTISDQVREALEAMTASAPLDGLIIDNRTNGGGLRSEAEQTLALFTEGYQGDYVRSEEKETLRVRPKDVGGSQAVPLVVMVGDGTHSFGEIFSGILENSGRATIVGETTSGNVELLFGYNFEDGSQAWIAGETFIPKGFDYSVWEEEGIVPSVFAPEQWELFTESNDPGIAAALEVLQ